MAKKREKEAPAQPIRINLNLGGLLGEINLDNVTELATRLQELKEKMEKDPSLKGKVKTDFRFRVRGLGKDIDVGTLPVGTWSEIPTTKPIHVEKRPVLQIAKLEGAGREPLVDVIDEQKTIRLIIELPGVNKQNINVSLIGNTVQISATNKDRKYHKNIELPVAVREITSKRYNNGVLEVILSKQEA